ncbi:MAG TPA: cation:proton antiporter [Dehalococcoidia bacterium]|nr:cation:proton antiporter [Dehalococcoidia bacterium]
MNLVLAIGLILSIGLFGSLAFRKLRLPSVTGYIIVGIILGPSVVGLIPLETVERLGVLTDITLGIVAYLIGGSLRVDSLKGLGRSILWVTLMQSIGAWIFVTVVLTPAILWIVPEASFWQLAFPLAFVVGAVSSATAPAATMAIIRELRARGPLTTTLLAVVALDDGIAVIAFAVAVGVCEPLVKGVTGISVEAALLGPSVHIVLSLVLGLIVSAIPVYGGRVVRSREVELGLIFGTVMLCAGAALWLGLSPVIADMTLGFVVVNVMHRGDEHALLGDVETLLYTLFFVLAGLHFDLAVLSTAGAVAIVIAVSGGLGKYAGTVAGARLGHAPAVVGKYLGFALLPKAGVTVGLALLAAEQFPSFGPLLLNAVLAATIINELIAPPLSRYAITRAGEAYPPPREGRPTTSR